MAIEPEEQTGQGHGEPEPKPVEDEAEGDGDRPTVAPPFDPAEFAKRSEGQDPERAPLPINVESLTQAPRGPRAVTVRSKTPSGVMQMANSQIPSRAPPKGPEDGAQPDIPRLSNPLDIAALDSVPDFRRSDSGDALDAPVSRPGPVPDLIEKAGSEPPPTRPAPPAAADLAQPLPSAGPPGPPKAHPPTSAPASGPPSEQDMNDRFALGDYSGALDVAEKLLLVTPNNDAVKGTAESCRNVLRAMFTARIGPLDRVPLVMVPRDQLRWLSIDHRAGFVLSLIDGVSSLEMILDVSGMQQLDALRILSELAQQRIISFR